MDKNSRREPENIVRRIWAGWRKCLPTRRSRQRLEEARPGGGLPHRLTYVAAFAGAVAILAGGGHLAAWLGGDLSRRGLTAITMKTNASLCLTLVGIALLLLVPAQAASARRWTARMCAAVAVLVGLLTLLENLSGWDFGIDQLLAAETPGAMAVVSPNRMGLPASLSFTLIGLALLILSRRDHRGVRVVQSLALAVCLFSLLATIGFLYGAREFYGIARYTAIAWPTAVSLLLLGLGLLCVRPTEGLMAQVTADDPGGLSLRRLLPTFLLLPLLLGWLRLAGERAGIFDAPTGTAMTMLLFIVIFSALAYHVGRRASRSAEALRDSQERLRAVFDNAGVGLVEVARDDRIVVANDRLCEILGYEHRDLLGKTIHELTAPEDRATSDNLNTQLHEGLINRIDYEKRYLRRDGSPVWVHVTVSPVYDSRGRWLHSIATVEDISERRGAEEALRESEERFRVAQELSPDGFTIFRPVCDPQGHVVDFTWVYENAAIARLNGTDPAAVVGHRLLEVLPSHADSPFHKAYQAVAESGQPMVLEAPFHGETMAQEKWFRVAVVPSGQDIAILAQEITERKRAEEALRESHARLKRVLEVETVGVMFWDLATGCMTDANDTFLKMMGYSRRDVETCQLSWQKLTPPEYVEVSLAEIRKFQATGRVGPYEKEYFRKDGTRQWLLFAGSSLGGSACVEFCVDIADRKKAEEALRRSEAKWNAAIEHFGEGAIIATEAEQVIYWNPAARSMHGFTSDTEGIGPLKETPNMFELWTPDGSHLLALDEWPMKRIKRGETVRNLELSLRRPDQGWEKIVSYSGTMVETASGERLIFLSVFDLTEQRRAEAALRELNATLERKVAQRTVELEHRARQLQKLTLELSQAEERERRRIAVLLHEDLQQQIAGARFQLGLVRSRTRDDATRASIERVDGMLKGAVEESRTLSHDLSPAVVHMNDLGEVLQWMVKRVQTQHGMHADVVTSGDMILDSEALAMFLFRAAQEMLFNVIKHARINEAAIRVRRVGRCICLQVSDRGRGFDPQQLKETSGIGLFSIRERTELLGGRMNVKSGKGRGSRIRITVPDEPRTKGTDMMTEEIADVHTESSTAMLPVSEGTLRVLLVDDHDIVREGLAALLEESPDVEVIGEAADGREAINLASDLRPDVVIMDVSMPLMSGDQATRQIKKHLPKTRVIALSMFDEAEKKERMYHAGAESYVLKTATADELLAAIRGKDHDL